MYFYCNCRPLFYTVHPNIGLLMNRLLLIETLIWANLKAMVPWVNCWCCTCLPVGTHSSQVLFSFSAFLYFTADIGFQGTVQPGGLLLLYIGRWWNISWNSFLLLNSLTLYNLPFTSYNQQLFFQAITCAKQSAVNGKILSRWCFKNLNNKKMKMFSLSWVKNKSLNPVTFLVEESHCVISSQGAVHFEEDSKHCKHPLFILALPRNPISHERSQ